MIFITLINYKQMRLTILKKGDPLERSLLANSFVKGMSWYQRMFNKKRPNNGLKVVYMTKEEWAVPNAIVAKAMFAIYCPKRGFQNQEHNSKGVI
jgi:hypothetical protein